MAPYPPPHGGMFRACLSLGFAMSLGILAAAPPEEAALRITPALEEGFQNNQRAWPQLGVGTHSDANIEGGVLRWTNKQNNVWQGSTLPITVSGRRPYELSLDVLHAPDSAAPAGLRWGGSDDGMTGNFVVLGPSGRFSLGRRENGATVRAEEGEAKAYSPSNYNRITLRVFGPKSVLFVNGVVSWVGDTLNATDAGLGVLVAGRGSASFDNLSYKHVRADEAVITERVSGYTRALGDTAQVFIDPPVVSASHVGDAVSAETLNTWENEAWELLRKKQFRAAEALYNRVLEQQPESSSSHLSVAWCHLALGNVSKARYHSDAALQLDPLGVVARAIALYTAAAVGDEPSVTHHAGLYAMMDVGGANHAGMEEDLVILAENGLAQAAALVRAKMQAARATPTDAYRGIAGGLEASADAARRGDAGQVAQAGKAAILAAQQLPSQWKHLFPAIVTTVGIQLMNTGDAAGARTYLEQAYPLLQQSTDPALAFLRINNATLVADFASSSADAQRAYTILVAERERALALPAYANRLKADLLNSLCRACATLNRHPEQRKYAAELRAIKGTGRDPWYEAFAHLQHASSFASSRIPSEVAEAKRGYERVLELARTHGYDGLEFSASADLALVYWKTGDKNRARDTYLQSARRAEERKDFVSAEQMLNNLGALQLRDKLYAQAVETFSKAVELTESARLSVPPEERVHLLAARASAYQFLVASLHHHGDTAALFEVESAIRGRALSEVLNLSKAPEKMSLRQMQDGLAADEAAVIFTITGPAEIVAHVITREASKSVFVDGRHALVALKKAHLDRIHRNRPGYKPIRETVYADGQAYNAGEAHLQISTADFEATVELYRELINAAPSVPRDVRARLMPEFSTALSGMLVTPIAAHLEGKKRLLLLPDGILNFLPFEALPMQDVRYLVEKFDVRYVQSPAVWRTLRNRTYAAEGRASFLGMGGALYSAMSEVAPPLESASRQVQLQIAAQRNLQTGASQREVYAALFGNKAMSYLKGSLIEVQALARLFPDGSVYFGEDMSEQRIKAMAADGSLAKFRVVHLATHGFAIPEIPELSGIAMTITPTAQGGEDGYLTAPEIAKLGMRADLAVLSACETGLGRIYNGEGVAGLTNALLVGGANRALVSLWPVSDAGTMQFMRDLYTLSTQEGMPYDTAVNVVKRRFLQGTYGEEFRDVNIWAPFIHYGL